MSREPRCPARLRSKPIAKRHSRESWTAPGTADALGPRDPREEAAYVELAALQDGETLADYGHVPLVELAKRYGNRFTSDAPVN